MSVAEEPGGGGQPQRLQKIIAAAGLASRRKAETLITEGRVRVNGQVVTELGAKADPMRDHIRVDGKLLHGPEQPRYYMLNKPKGYVTTVSDPEKRPTVMSLAGVSATRVGQTWRREGWTVRLKRVPQKPSSSTLSKMDSGSLPS